MEDILRELLFRARLMMPDKLSAERLVEAVLHHAISQAERGMITGDVKEHLLVLLEEEHRTRGSLYIHEQAASGLACASRSTP